MTGELDYIKCEVCNGTGSIWYELNQAEDQCDNCGGHKTVPVHKFGDAPDSSVTMTELGTGKVVRLTDRQPVDSAPPVDKDLVDRLEMLLAEARAGKLFSVGLATITPEQGATTFSHVYRGGSCVTLAGAISRLLHNLHKDLDTP